MKIVITVNSSWNIYNFRMGLVEAFIQKGYEVIAAAPPDEYSALLEKAGCKFYPLKMENKGSNPVKDIALYFQLRRIYKKVRPDIILQFTIKPNIYGTLAASALGIPVINNVSGLGTTFLHNNIISRAAHLLYKFSFRYATKVFFQNDDDRQLFLQKKLVKKEAAALVPGSGVKIEKYNPGPFRRNQPLVFLVIARLLYDKGVVEYIDAIKIIKSRNLAARFQIMGALDEQSSLGIPRATLDKWIKDDLVEYIPFQKDILPYLGKADCIVLPSYREGTPKTLLEGAAMAKPLITTDVPGCREAVDDGRSGYLCRVKDPVDLADKIQKVIELTDSDLMRLGQNSREKVVLMFDERFVVDEYLKSIHQILSNKKERIIH